MGDAPFAGCNEIDSVGSQKALSAGRQRMGNNGKNVREDKNLHRFPGIDPRPSSTL